MFLNHVNSLSTTQYIPLSQFSNKKVLVKDNNAFSLVSNVCPHQKSLISSMPGTGARICPYHGWSFTPTGNPIGSGRTSYYCKNETPLESLPVFEWNSLLFSENVEFEKLVDFSDVSFVEHRVDVVDADYRNIMDLFLDVDHIPVVHPGVYDKIGLRNINNVEWTYYNNGSVQVVRDDNGNIGALWIAVYPYTMIEWQSGNLFITVSNPVSHEQTSVSVYKFRQINAGVNIWELNDSVWETAWAQDKSQAELITEFATTNLEEQKQHFRNFL